MIKKFKIKSMQSDKYFLVRIYPNVKELREAAVKHSKKTGENSPLFKDTYGVCHTYERIKIKPDGAEEMINEIGTIRLSNPNCRTGIVAHEVVHAAMHLYRLLYGVEHEYEGSTHNADFGNGCNEDEENFAYIYGELFHDMTKKLYKFDVWS
jgi:hypothetical protein